MLTTLQSNAWKNVEAGDFAEASTNARQLLELVNDPELPEFVRSDGDAVHSVYTILGIIALRASKLSDAKRLLISSANVAATPSLASFGPSMYLANEILKLGEVEVVIEYLECCKKFCESGTENIDAWILEIANKKQPDFGANLIYRD